MLPTSAGLNPRPPGLQSDGASNWATEAYAWCNICTKLGHFAVVCWFKEHKHKSARSKQRDTERMTTFINKKTEEMLSFFGVSTDDLTAFFPKNACMKETHQKEPQELQRSASREKADFFSTQMGIQTKLPDIPNQLTKNRESTKEQKMTEMWLNIS